MKVTINDLEVGLRVGQALIDLYRSAREAQTNTHPNDIAPEEWNLASLLDKQRNVKAPREIVDSYLVENVMEMIRNNSGWRG